MYRLIGLPVLTLSILGAVLQIPVLSILGIVGICVLVILALTPRIQERAYPYLLFAIGLSLIYSTTLFSPYLIGNDIHLEFYYVQKAMSGWDTSIAHPFNSSMALTVITPFLSKILHISPYWVMKVIFPLFLATTPVILYYIYLNFLKEKQAFLASLLVAFLPPFFMEVPAIMKMVIALPFFAMLAFLIIDRRFNIPMKWKILGIIGCCLLAVVFHYTMGMVSILFLIIAIPTIWVVRFILKRQTFPLKWASLCLAVLMLTGGLYWGLVARGTALSCVIGLGQFFAGVESGQHARLPTTEEEGIWMPGYKPPEDIFDYQPPDTAIPNPGEGTEPRASLFGGEQLGLVQVALGLDFGQASIWGKAFRIIQWLTQLFVVMGGLYVLRRAKKFPIEWLAFAAAGVVIILLNIIVPSFQSVLNPTRWYLLAMMFLTPLFVLAVGKRLYLAGILLIVYLLFTSGLVFEVTGSQMMKFPDLPYSVTLSQHRIDLGTAFTGSDKEVADYIYDKNLRPVIGDFHGFALLEEKWGKEGGIGIVPVDVDDIKPPMYIFLRARNNEKQIITYWTSIGLRKSYTWDEKKFGEIIQKSHLVYWTGNAEVLYYEEG